MSCKHSNASGLEAEVMVCHPEMSNVDILGKPKLQNKKHMSIHKLDVKFKSIKKVEQIRLFNFETSVYAKWKKDTNKMMERAFELDAQYLKCFKFIKDPNDLNNVLKVL